MLISVDQSEFVIEYFFSILSSAFYDISVTSMKSWPNRISLFSIWWCANIILSSAWFHTATRVQHWEGYTYGFCLQCRELIKRPLRRGLNYALALTILLTPKLTKMLKNDVSIQWMKDRSRYMIGLFYVKILHCLDPPSALFLWNFEISRTISWMWSWLKYLR